MNFYFIIIKNIEQGSREEICVHKGKAVSEFEALKKQFPNCEVKLVCDFNEVVK